MKQLTLEMYSAYLPHEASVSSDMKGTDIYKLTPDNLTEAIRMQYPLLLRNPRSLTQPITHKGETFYPIQVLAKIAYPNKNWNKRGFAADDKFHFHFSKCGFVLKIPKGKGPIKINAPHQLQLFNKLREWHFAIDTPESLYIDLDTLT